MTLRPTIREVLEACDRYTQVNRARPLWSGFMNIGGDVLDGPVPVFPADQPEMAAYHPKVIAAAISKCIGLGLLECGVSERTAWVTDKGLSFLKADRENRAFYAAVPPESAITR